MTKVVLSPGQNDAVRTLEIFCRLVPSPLLKQTVKQQLGNARDRLYHPISDLNAAFFTI